MTHVTHPKKLPIWPIDLWPIDPLPSDDDIIHGQHIIIMKLRSDPLCPFCKEDSETSLHFLGYCMATIIIIVIIIIIITNGY